MIYLKGLKVREDNLCSSQSYKVINPTDEEKKALSKIFLIDFKQFVLNGSSLAESGMNVEENKVIRIDFNIPYKEESDTYRLTPATIFIKDKNYILNITREVESLDIFLKKAEDAKNLESLLVNILLYNKRVLKPIENKIEKAIEKIKKDPKDSDLEVVFNIQNTLAYLDFAVDGINSILDEGIMLDLIEDDKIINNIKSKVQNIDKTIDIYLNILDSTLDYAENVINNKLNDIIKFLTVVTVALSFPTIVAGYWGMNVKVPFAQHSMGFLIVIGVSFIFVILTVVWSLKKRIL